MGFLIHGFFPSCKTVFLCPSSSVKLYFSTHLILSRTPCGRAPPPPSRDLPCAGCAWQAFIVCAARLSSGVVRELLGFRLGCRRLKCLLSTFLSASLDDFEDLGANFALLERSWSFLGRPSGGPGPSWVLLGRS